MADTPRAFDVPLMEQPISVQLEGSRQSRVEFIWWRFFQNLIQKVSFAVHSVTTQIIAAGTTQATATQLGSLWNQVNVAPANSGVIMEPFGIGTATVVFNDGANTLKVYPPVGYLIDGGAVNDPYLLAAGKSQTFYQLASTSYKSTILG